MGGRPGAAGDQVMASMDIRANLAGLKVVMKPMGSWNVHPRATPCTGRTNGAAWAGARPSAVDVKSAVFSPAVCAV